MMVIKIITKIIGCILLFIASYVWAAMEIRMDEKIPKKKQANLRFVVNIVRTILVMFDGFLAAILILVL